MKHYFIKHFRRCTLLISFFYGTMLPHIRTKAPHWDWITNQIMLGALPIKSKCWRWGGHHSKIVNQAKAKQKPLGLVVSAVQAFEIEGKGLPFKPVSPHDWQEVHVSHQHISIPDFSAKVLPKDVRTAIERMHQAIKTNHSVYIHCKAGRGRSWMVLMCYLTTFGGMDFPQAEKLVREKRMRVAPSLEQVQFVKDFVLKYKSKK